jgi:hypothetical protein
MTFLRVKTIKGKRYLYRQRSVRKGKKVHSIMEYVCALGWIAASAASPGYVGSKGHKSTDKRVIKHQDSHDRERHAKRMENPREAWEEARRKGDIARAEKTAKSKPVPESTKDKEIKEAIREFNEARAKEKEPPSSRPDGPKLQT